MKKITIASFAIAMALVSSMGTSAFAKSGHTFKHIGKVQEQKSLKKVAQAKAETAKAKQSLEKAKAENAKNEKMLNKEKAGKHKEHQKGLAHVVTELTNKLAKLQAKEDQLSKSVTSFYGQTQAVDVESNFYYGSSGKIKAMKNQINEMKRELNRVSKYGSSDAATALTQSLNTLGASLDTLKSSLDTAHQGFVAANPVPAPTSSSDPQQAENN